MNEKATLFYNPEDTELLEVVLGLREVYQPDFEIVCDTSRREPEVVVVSDALESGPGHRETVTRFRGKKNIERELLQTVVVSIRRRTISVKQKAAEARGQPEFLNSTL